MLSVVRAGTLPYSAASGLQEILHQKRAKDEIDDTLLLLEHPHVYTLGRRFKPEHLVWDEAERAARQIEVQETDRGGSITYHGPGQLIAYPILKLDPRGLNVIAYLRVLEEAIIRTLADFGVTGERRDGLTGVWLGNCKIASIGVRLSRGVTKHGVAINVSNNLEYFNGIVACGISKARSTSLELILERKIDLEEVSSLVEVNLAQLLKATPVSCSLGELLPESSPAPPVARPPWLKNRLQMGPNYLELKSSVRNLRLHTVCEEAKCPNMFECWEAREATFLILGDRCTRRCSFCDIATAKPLALDLGEPLRVAEAALSMGLKFAVVTGVERDDVAPIEAARIWAATIRAIHGRVAGCGVEVLTGDFKGQTNALEVVLQAEPEVFAHNIETVKRLHPAVRPGFRYERSLELLQAAGQIKPDIPTKSNLILGLGEIPEEVIEAMQDLRQAGVVLLTIGQYLSPSTKHASVRRWADPAEFEGYKKVGEQMGFAWVESGPLVRSSYQAGRQYRAAAARVSSRLKVQPRGESQPLGA